MDKCLELSNEERKLIVDALYELRYWADDNEKAAVEALIVRLDSLASLRESARANGWVLSKQFAS